MGLKQQSFLNGPLVKTSLKTLIGFYKKHPHPMLRVCLCVCKSFSFHEMCVCICLSLHFHVFFCISLWPLVCFHVIQCVWFSCCVFLIFKKITFTCFTPSILLTLIITSVFFCIHHHPVPPFLFKLVFPRVDDFTPKYSPSSYSISVCPRLLRSLLKF